MKRHFDEFCDESLMEKEQLKQARKNDIDLMKMELKEHTRELEMV